MRAEQERLHTLAYWTGNGFTEDFEYDVIGNAVRTRSSLAKNVITRSICRSLFPKDRELVKLSAQSYLGVPVRNSSGEILGHLGVMHVAPMSGRCVRAWGIMRVFATRAAAELERRDTAIKLQGRPKTLRRQRIKSRASSLATSVTKSEHRLWPCSAPPNLSSPEKDGANGQLDFSRGHSPQRETPCRPCR